MTKKNDREKTPAANSGRRSSTRQTSGESVQGQEAFQVEMNDPDLIITAQEGTALKVTVSVDGVAVGPGNCWTGTSWVTCNNDQ